jgi:ubiquinone/menaquinone biosynthesis C-methylase UbiE
MNEHHSLENESLRILETYGQRDARGKSAFYSWYQKDAAYMRYRQTAAWAAAFKKIGLVDLTGLKVIDVGCGLGWWLRMLSEWGCSPSDLHGVDLLADRINEAKRLSPPEMDFRVGNSWPLPYQDVSMDICAASTVFSSILDSAARLALAEEMRRVLRPGGWIMVFDYVVSDPHNPDTIGIGRGEIERLFSGFKLAYTARLILAPPLLRRLPGYLLWMALCLETFIPFLCTHRLYLLRKQFQIDGINE